MYRSTIDEECGRLLNDPDHTRWVTDTLHDRIELAQLDVQQKTGAVKTTESLTPTASTAEVTVDDDVLDITRVTITDSTGDIYPLEGRSREDLDFYEPNWPNLDPGKPAVWFFDASNRQIVLVPPPSATYAVASGLKAWEVRRPQTLTGDTSEPFDANVLMQAYAMSVIYWVVAQCWLDNGDPESIQKAKVYRSDEMLAPGLYEKQLSLINAKFNRPAGIPERIKWMPQGGRISHGGRVSKSYPLG